MQTIDDFSVGRTLGKGMSSVVRRARRADDDQEYALKIFTLNEDFTDTFIVQLMEQEAQALQAC